MEKIKLFKVNEHFTPDIDTVFQRDDFFFVIVPTHNEFHEFAYNIIVNPKAKSFLHCLIDDELKEGIVSLDDLCSYISINREILNRSYTEWYSLNDILNDVFVKQLETVLYEIKNSYEFSDEFDKFAEKIVEVSKTENFETLEKVFDEKVIGNKKMFADFKIVIEHGDKIWDEIKEIIKKYSTYEYELKIFKDFVQKNQGCGDLEISYITDNNI